MRIKMLVKAAPGTGVTVLLIVLATEIVPPLARAAAPVSLSLKGEWPGHARGPAMGVAVQGKYAYVAASSVGLIVLDISDPAKPAPVASYESPSASAFALSGNHAFLLRDVLEVVDIRDPANPWRTGHFKVGGGAIAVSDDHAYIVDRNGLQVINVRNPARPVWVGGYENRLTRGLTGVAVSGNYACLSGGGWDAELRRKIPGLLVFDVTDPTNPKRMGTYESPGTTLGMAISGDHAFLVAPDGLLVIDISNPASPRQVGRYAASRGSGDRSVAILGNLAYVAGHWADGPISPEPPDWKHGLQVIDIGNPSNPRRVGSCDTGGDVWRVVVSGNQAYVAAQGDGLQVIDISNPTSPQQVGGYETGANSEDVAVAGDYAFLAEGEAGLQVIDVSNPSNPERVAGYDFRGAVLGVAVTGTYAYLVANDTSFGVSGFHVLDISNPVSPTRVGTLSDVYVSDLVIAGKHAYLGGENLEIVDVSNPANPVRVGSFQRAGSWNALAVSGGFAYMDGWLAETDSPRGLVILDVSNPSNPHRVGGIRGNGITGIALSGNYAYVTLNNYDDWFGYLPGDSLLVLQISNPASPIRMAGYDLGPAYDITMAGRFAYVRGPARVHVFDLGNPANPALVGTYESDQQFTGLTAKGNRVYVAQGSRGLLILEQFRPAWLEISSVSPFTFRLSGEPGTGVRVQRSANLADWDDWQSATLSDAPLEFSDPEATEATARFYRAVKQ